MLRTTAKILIAIMVMASAAVAHSPLNYFSQRPTGADFADAYPLEALIRNQAGAADLCCSPGLMGTLRCKVDREWPEGQGFGEASLKVAAAFRLSAAGQRELEKQSRGGLVRVPIRWNLDSSSPRQLEQRSRITQSWLATSSCGTLLIS